MPTTSNGWCHPSLLGAVASKKARPANKTGGDLAPQWEESTAKEKLRPSLIDAMVSIEEENMPAATRVDIEDVLSNEWDFGVSAMTIDAIRILIAGE